MYIPYIYVSNKIYTQIDVKQTNTGNGKWVHGRRIKAISTRVTILHCQINFAVCVCHGIYVDGDKIGFAEKDIQRGSVLCRVIIWFYPLDGIFFLTKIFLTTSTIVITYFTTHCECYKYEKFSPGGDHIT